MNATNAMNYKIFEENKAWQTDMSNTAMQRRVSDLQKAGLNPLLATGQQGAAVPSVASPVMQPAGQVWGNLGAQTQAAQVTAAQVAKTQADTDFVNAQTRKLKGETPDTSPSSGGVAVFPAKPDGTPDWDKMPPTPGNFSARQQQAQVAQAEKTVDLIQSDINLKQSQRSGQDVQNLISGLTRQQLQATLDYTIQTAAANLKIANAEAASAENVQKIMKSPAGVWITAASQVLGGGGLVQLIKHAIPGAN